MFRLATFGTLSLTDSIGAEVAIPRRRLAILVMLACAGERGLSRDKLMAYLWPESSSEDARHSLEQLLYSLRRSLGADIFGGTDPLRLNAGRIASDLAAFEGAIDRNADAEAVAAYTGAFLDGFHLRNAEFERWVDDERTRLSAAYSAALERLADRATEAGDWGAAISARRKLVALDPLSTRGAFGLVRALAAGGDRAEALRTAAAYESLVQKELSLPLEPAFASFVASLRTADGRLRQAVPAPSSAVPTPAVEAQAPAAEANVRVFKTARLLGAALVIVAGWLVLRFGTAWRATTTTPPRQRVAVAVFENRTGDTTLDIVGIMTTEYTRIALASTELLDVVAPAFDLWQPENAHSGHGQTIKTLARQTGATIVVSGAYYREGNVLVFTGQGVDANSGRLIFGFDSVKASVGKRREAAEQVSGRVMSAVATHIDPALTPWAGHTGHPPVRFDAYQEFADGMTNFVRGIAAQHNGSNTALPFDSARVHLERAFRLDSTYYVAALWWFWSRYNVGDRQGADSVLRMLEPRRTSMSRYERVLHSYNTALMRGSPEERYQLDKQLVDLAPASEFLFCLARDALESNHPLDALGVLDRVDDSYSWRRLMELPRGFRIRALVEQGEDERAARMAQRMLNDAPADLTPAYPAIDALASLGRLDEIEAIARGADSSTYLARPPAANLMLYAGLRLRALGQRDRSERLFARAVAANTGERVGGGAADVLRGRARGLYYLGQWEASRAAFDQLAGQSATTSVNDWRTFVFLGALAARRGDTAEVGRLRALLGAPSMNPAAGQYFEARVAAVRGESERAINYLAAAVSLGVLADEVVTGGEAPPSMDPDFAALRGTPAFKIAAGRW